MSGYGKMKVMKLLKNNGLKEFEVIGNLDELEVEDKENVIMFGGEEDVEKMGEMGMRCVLGLGEMWKEIGIKRVRSRGFSLYLSEQWVIIVYIFALWQSNGIRTLTSRKPRKDPLPRGRRGPMSSRTTVKSSRPGLLRRPQEKPSN